LALSRPPRFGERPLRAPEAIVPYGFVLATENEIRIQSRLDNAVLTASVVDRFFPKDRIRAGIDAVLALPNGSSVRDIERLLGGRCDGLDVAIHLAWKGLIRLAPMRKWTRDTTFVRSRPSRAAR
jgi:hypothetical protein